MIDSLSLLYVVTITQIHEVESFDVAEFTLLSDEKLLALRGRRPRTNKLYSTHTPSKIAFL